MTLKANGGDVTILNAASRCFGHKRFGTRQLGKKKGPGRTARAEAQIGILQQIGNSLTHGIAMIEIQTVTIDGVSPKTMGMYELDRLTRVRSNWPYG